MKKYSLLYLVVGIGVLVIVMQKIILPLVYDVIKSDAFLIDSKDQASQLPISNSMTDLAFTYCNNAIKEKLGKDVSVAFPEKPLNAWSLGNYEYIISAEISITDSSKNTQKKYACRIIYENSDDQEGVNDIKNWSIEGIDGI